MRLLTWNVNGIRAVMKKGFIDIMASLDPDFVCIQETKAQPDQIEIDEDLYPYIYINSAKKKGYSGTMILTRFEPENVFYGIGQEEHDQEGRVITLEYSNFYVVTVYTPNSGEGLKRLEYRQSWDKAFGKYIAGLNEKKPVMLCGDLNVAHTSKDIWEGYKDTLASGNTPQEKEGLNKYLLPILTDAYRKLYPDKTDQYTWWSYYSRDRDKNRGWRIDYWLVSPSIIDKVEDVIIYDDIYGSDHCPVELDIHIEAE